jgi:hypothetical protein
MNQAPGYTHNKSSSPEAVQARLAMRFASALTEHQLEAVSPDIAARLSFAREQAMAAARKAQRVAAPAILGSAGGAAVLAGGPDSDMTPWWLRLGSLVPLAVLLAGLVLIENHYARSQIDAAADVDAAILADDLPPEAYRDRGFVEFLRTARP